MHFRDRAVFHKGTDNDTITGLACLYVIGPHSIRTKAYLICSAELRLI
jgi:hypothetical protein